MLHLRRLTSRIDGDLWLVHRNRYLRINERSTPGYDTARHTVQQHYVIIYFPSGSLLHSQLLNQSSVAPSSALWVTAGAAIRFDKKLSYRRETARQLPTWRGARPSAHSPYAPFDCTYAYGRIRNPQQTYVKRAVHQAHFKMNRAFKVIQGHPYWCRTVCCRNVQFMPTLFLKLMKIWQRENGKFVDFNDPSQVWRRPSKKRLRISTNGLYCQKLESLTYIFAADSMDLRSLVFT